MTLPTNEERWRAMLGAESREALRLRRELRAVDVRGREAGLDVLVVRPAG